VTEIVIHGFTLSLPDDHWLPQIRNQLPNYSENIGRLAAAVEQKYPGRGFIDFGANVGDTAAIVRSHSKLPILCIERSQYRQLLEDNVRRIPADVELECPSGNGIASSTPLNTILARHPSFQTSKILKIAGSGMHGSMLESIFEWMAAAHPIVYWRHGLGYDATASGQRSTIFDRLLAAGYRTALVFDNTGEFIQTLSLDARQQLAEICEYFPGGEQCYAYGDVCVFHDEDVDLCERFRQVEIDHRRTRGKTTQESIPHTMGEDQRTELAGVRAHIQLDRHRLQLRIAELESRIRSKDAEIERLHTVLRDLLRSEDLKAQLAGLRQELDTSLVLRLARSLHWFLGPIRRWIGPKSNGGRP
jgi:hypothetical protein